MLIGVQSIKEAFSSEESSSSDTDSWEKYDLSSSDTSVNSPVLIVTSEQLDGFKEEKQLPLVNFYKLANMNDNIVAATPDSTNLSSPGLRDTAQCNLNIITSNSCFNLMSYRLCNKVIQTP